MAEIMKRRNFFSWLGISWLASLFPMAIAACSRQTATSAPAPTTRKDGFTSIGTIDALAQTGFLQAKIAGKSVIVMPDSTRQNALRAIDLTCTHTGCLVDWQAKGKTFECPCHDSQFAADGKVLQGPAQKALQTYPAKLAGKSILVKVN
jgi:cytochrome b6-f complex iron-sulfur subunit